MASGAATGGPVLRLAAALFIFVAVCVSGPEHARAESHHTPFDDKELARFMRTWPVFVSWAGHNQITFEAEHSPIGYAWQERTGTFLREQGWDPERFFTVAHRAELALINLQMRTVSPFHTSKNAPKVPFIEDNPHISKAQKRMMQNRSRDIFGRPAHKKTRIQKTELRAVMPHEETLFRLFLNRK